MGQTRIRNVCTDGRTDGQSGIYMLPRIFSGSIIINHMTVTTDCTANYFLCVKAITQWWTLADLSHEILTVTTCGQALQYWSLHLACVRISEQFKVRLNVVERWMCIDNQYLYTSLDSQKSHLNFPVVCKITNKTVTNDIINNIL